MYQPRHELAAVRAHGDDVAAVAHGDDGVLQILLHGRGTDDGVEPLAHLVVQGAQAAADIVQLRAGAVGHFLLGEDGVEDFLLQRAVCGQLGSDLRKRARVLAVAYQRAAHRARCAQPFGDGQKRLHRKRRTDLGKLQIFRYVAEIGHRRAAVVGVGGQGFLRFPLQTAHLGKIARGPQRPCRRLARLGHGQPRQPVQYFRIFQYAQVSFLHRHSTPRKDIPAVVLRLLQSTPRK